MNKIMLLLIMVFLVGTVSAVEWNDKLTYSNEDLKVSWENWWGLGKTIGTIELKSHKSVDEVKKVSVGKDKVVVWYDFNFADLYIDGIGEITFKNMKTEEYFERDYSLVYWGEKEINIYDLGNCGKTLSNGTKINCEQVIIGVKNVYDWLLYNSQDIPKGNIRIGVMVNVKSGEKTDVIWTIAGKEVSRHAVFTGNGEFSDDIEIATAGGQTTITGNLKALTNGIITETRMGSTSGSTVNSTTYIIQNGVVLAQKDTLNWKFDDAPYVTFIIGDYSDAISPTLDNGNFIVQTNKTAGSGSMAEKDSYGAFSGTLFNYSAQVMMGRHNSQPAVPLYTFNETTTPPIVTLNSPIDTFNATNNIIIFNGTVTSPIGITNVTLFINGILNETNSSGINDTDYLFTKTIADGSHNWTYESCNADGCTTATTRTFTITDFIINQFTFNASSFETANERFTINITTNGSIPSSAKLIYNGTTFTGATITNTAGNDFNITRTIDIPLVNGTKSWFFNITVNGAESSSTTQNQTINLTDFQHITSGISYINISFKNETIAEESVTAQIDTDWTFWLGSGTVFKTLSFTNTTENVKYEFALLNGANRTLTANVSLIYDNSISEQRSFSKSYTLTNVTTQQILFLLPTSDGVFVTFQTVTIAEQVITDVQANVTKSGDLISTGITDDAGLVQYFLDPDTTYVFSFFKEGFALVTTTLKPTQSSFTITMGTITAPIQNDTTKGISYTISPLANVLSNNTETEFNLTFSSVFFGLDSFGFALKNSTGNVFNTTTSTTETGGFLSRTLNTGNNADIIMEVFWTIEGNQTNITRSWKVLDTSDEGFSIKNFFDDLSIYLTSGLFGLTSFGLGIIIFMIILITTGVLSTKFGITSPAGISVIVFAMVLFFDVGLGIMPNPVNAVPNFPTIFVGIVFLGLFFKEAIIR